MLEELETYARARQGWLFPWDGSQDRGPAFQCVGNTWLRKIGITDKRVSIHGFRHLWRTLARSMAMPVAVVEAIQGWAAKEMSGAYGERVPLALRAKWIARSRHGALRGLAQSMARELAPKGIHVAHFVIDGGVRNAARGRVEGANASPESYLDPDAIAESYMRRQAAAQRLDMGGGTAALGRAVLISLVPRNTFWASPTASVGYTHFNGSPLINPPHGEAHDARTAACMTIYAHRTG
jgi:hypothetical protein